MSDDEADKRIIELDEKALSFAMLMIYSRMHSIFSQKTRRSKDKRTSSVRQRISLQVWSQGDMQISENQRVRLLSLAQESGQNRCTSASSGQNTGNPFRASRQ